MPTWLIYLSIYSVVAGPISRTLRRCRGLYTAAVVYLCERALTRRVMALRSVAYPLPKSAVPPGAYLCTGVLQYHFVASDMV
jgi:hypothetical protein